MSSELKARASLTLAGLTFRGLQRRQLLDHTEGLKIVVTVNADFIVRSASDKRFHDIICNNFATCDGQIVVWLAKLLGRPRGVRFEKISGSSFANDVLEHAAEHNLRVFFLGAAPSVNSVAVQRSRARFAVNVTGYSPPLSGYPALEQWNADILREIAAARPDILFVAFGSPKQELWIDDHRRQLEQLGVRLAMGCGGTLDFLAATIRRAPAYVQNAGLEGLYRLMMEPNWMRLRRLLRSLLVFPIVFWKTMHPNRNHERSGK